MFITGYDDLSEIGRGGSSTVYAATQQPLGRVVAVKVLQVDLGDDAARRRFERECAVVGALGDAPGIVPVYAAAFTDDGRGCIVMRLMAASLAELLGRHGPLSVAQVREVGIVGASALAHAHSRGIVHRDVKPANLLISEFGEIALGDFDIASIGEWASSTLTQDSMSPPHAPPERLNGQSVSGPLGDVWSLGSTLFTLLDGQPPFGAASTEGGMAGLIDRIQHRPVPPLARDDVPDELRAVIERALAKDPADRWPDAAAMGAALSAVPASAPQWPAVDARRRGGAPPARVAGHDTAGAPVNETVAEPIAERAASSRRLVDWATLTVIALVVIAAVLAGTFVALR